MTIKEVLQEKWPIASYWEKVYIASVISKILHDAGYNYDCLEVIFTTYTKIDRPGLAELLRVADEFL